MIEEFDECQANFMEIIGVEAGLMPPTGQVPRLGDVVSVRMENIPIQVQIMNVVEDGYEGIVMGFMDVYRPSYRHISHGKQVRFKKRNIFAIMRK